jgi:pheromone alpha factor receptor
MSSSTNATTYPPPADPFTQPVTILLPDGTPFNVTMDQFAWFHAQMAQLAVSRGAALGATLVMLLAVAALTPAPKRGSPVFALKLAALALNACRTLFMAVWVPSAWTSPYAVLANDFSEVPVADYGASIAVPVFTFLALGTVLASLLLQVRVALAAARRTVRLGVLSACGVLALLSLATEMVVVVINIKVQILNPTNMAGDEAWERLIEANNLVMMLAFLLFTLVFVGKLGVAIWAQMRRLSTAQRFGPLQVLFIMGVQTLVVPSKSFPCPLALFFLES